MHKIELRILVSHGYVDDGLGEGGEGGVAAGRGEFVAVDGEVA